MSWLKSLLATIQEFLAHLGVAEASRPALSLGLLYLLATVVVCLFVFLIWRRGRRIAAPDSQPRDAGFRESSAADAPTSRRETGTVVDASTGATPLSAEAAFARVRLGLGKTRSSLVGRLDSLFGRRSGFDQELIDELEEILITSDFGMPTTFALIDALKARFSGTSATSSEVYLALKAEIASRLKSSVTSDTVAAVSPQVVMVVGVNGVGKTTTIGKLANLFQAEGKKVLLGAGDTFRAAAADQLAIWAERAGVDIVRHKEGGDPAAVAFDAVRAAVARHVDVLLFDTAGRLHTKANLMEELKKVSRVLGRELAGAPHQTLLVVDATTGQNALAQARLFKEAVQVDGIVLTKLDGTAKGGIVVAISTDLQIPVRYIGIGEAIDDLRPFDPELFVEALFGAGDGA